MKIKATCRRCDREVFGDQIVASGGSCPWDGEPFSPDYAVVMVEALREADDAGSRLETALQQLASLQPAFTIEAGSVTGAVSAAVAPLTKNLISQG